MGKLTFHKQPRDNRASKSRVYNPQGLSGPNMFARRKKSGETTKKELHNWNS